MGVEFRGCFGMLSCFSKRLRLLCRVKFDSVFYSAVLAFEMENVKGANLIWVEDYRGPIENYGAAKMTTLMGILCLKIEDHILQGGLLENQLLGGAHTVI